jgi:hypothetical protein
MVLVKYIHDRVNKTLSRKNQAGYSTTEDFNGDLKDSENMFMEFLYKKFEETQKISDALNPFVREVELPIFDGFIQYPLKYRHPLEMVYKYTKSSPECKEPISAEILMDKLQTNEERDTMVSAIRKPSLENGLLYWTQLSDRIRIRPNTLTGSVLFKYLINPTYGEYKTTIDFNNQVEVYDPSSVDLMWNEQETTDIIDLVLFHKGVSIRDSELLNFAMQKMQISK